MKERLELVYIEHLPCPKHCEALVHEVPQDIFSYPHRLSHFIDKDSLGATRQFFHVAWVGFRPGPSDLSFYFLLCSSDQAVRNLVTEVNTGSKEKCSWNVRFLPLSSFIPSPVEKMNKPASFLPPSLFCLGCPDWCHENDDNWHFNSNLRVYKAFATSHSILIYKGEN